MIQPVFWNTLHRAKEALTTVYEGEVRMYTCGPTVYNPVTLGNWRAFWFDDQLKRALRAFGYQVTHVMNITDVGHLVGDTSDGEDKVEREAKRTGQSAWDIAKSYEASFREGMRAMHILRDSDDAQMCMPRATEHIQEQIDLILRLEEKGFTYRIDDGIYFDTQRFAAYGALSGQSLDEKEAGARVEENAQKHHPADFALWKFSPQGEQRHMEWPSPWGVGFPGWHIECSAMAREYLGQPFDIHCGGVDHIPVHHENEIAQSEAAYGVPLAHVWMHNEFLLIDGGRMGKSLGNAYTLEDVTVHGCDALDVRYFFLGTHYRQKQNFTWEGLEAARVARRKLQMKYASYPDGGVVHAETYQAFLEALANDLNTPQAVAVVWELVNGDEVSEAGKKATLAAMNDVLMIGIDEAPVYEDAPADVLTLAKLRDEARARKDWAMSDTLRDELLVKGWLVEDTPSGFVLRKKT